MTNSFQPNCIDLDLVDQVISLIPDATWHLVKPAIVGAIIDAMPSDVLEKLTNDPQGFDRAEEILMSYYNNVDQKFSLIQDSFKILGSEDTLYLLDALQLDRYIEFKQQQAND